MIKNSPSTILSIITVTKNDLGGLKKTLNSIIGLKIISIIVSATNQELICDEKNLIKKFEREFQIKYYRQNTKGIFSAMNEGIFYAKSDWIQFINSGDEIINGKSLIKYLSTLKSKNTNAVFFRSKSLDTKKNFLGMNPVRFPKSIFLYSILFKLLPNFFYPNHQSVLFNSDFHKKNLYKDVVIGADQLLIDNINILKNVQICNLIVSKFYCDGISSNSPLNKKQLLKQLKSCYLNAQIIRAIKIIFKYVLAKFMPKNYLNTIRKFRYKYIGLALDKLMRLF
tara:strand:+ start:95 stop:940 length:846 start_codon:yes stop_codon:yes gene_type:complete